MRTVPFGPPSSVRDDAHLLLVLFNADSTHTIIHLELLEYHATLACIPIILIKEKVITATNLMEVGEDSI